MKLFGGAITAEISESLLDASDLREIPDHQEVYVGTWDKANVSLIVELMEPLHKPTLLESLSFHIDEAHRVSDTDTSKLTTNVEIVNSRIGQYNTVYRVDVLNEEKEKTVLLFALFNLKQFDTDVLVTATGSLPPLELGLTPIVDGLIDITTRLIKTFEVHDPNLFQ